MVFGFLFSAYGLGFILWFCVGDLQFVVKLDAEPQVLKRGLISDCLQYCTIFEGSQPISMLMRSLTAQA